MAEKGYFWGWCFSSAIWRWKGWVPSATSLGVHGSCLQSLWCFTSSSLVNPKFGRCCLHGKVVLPHLTWPPWTLELLLGSCKDFLNNPSHKYSMRDPSISTSTSGVTMLPLLLCHWVISQMNVCQVREDLLCSRLEGCSTVMAPSYQRYIEFKWGRFDALLIAIFLESRWSLCLSVTQDLWTPHGIFVRVHPRLGAY